MKQKGLGDIMGNIWRIYKRDIKNVVTNWVAIVIILGIIILPSLYAWFNIKSSWDPYGKTSGISVAVVNNDAGSEFKGMKLNVGKQMVDHLKENHKIGWKFVDEDTAKKGVMYGKYYASITIPKDFSYKILSITRTNIEKPNLIYSVNEKTNAVAPKITQKGVDSVQSEINKTFIKMVNEIALDIFKKFSIELEKEKPKINELLNMIFYVDSKIPEINKNVDEFYNGAIKLDEFNKRVKKDMPILSDTVKKTSEITKDAQEFLNKSQKGLNNIGPYIKQDLIVSRGILNQAEEYIPIALDFIDTNVPKAKSSLKTIENKLSIVYEKVTNNRKFLNSLGKLSNTNVIKTLISKLDGISSRLNNKIYFINSIINSLEKGEQPSIDILNNLRDKEQEIGPILDSIIDRFDEDIMPSINNEINKISSVADNTINLLNNANKDLPLVNDLLSKAMVGTQKGIEDIKLLKQRLPEIEKSIHETSNKLKKLNNDKKLDEVIAMLKNDGKKESEFMASPVEIKTDRIFPIPNYGSAMSPFFTTLSLWVGGLIIASLLSVNVKKTDELNNFTIYQAHVGRYLTFMTIAIFQSLVVSIGDLFILKVYCSNPLMFVLNSVLISIVFSLIIYTLVSIFGDVGKALSVILLVLQLSSSGGTFPIEVTPVFFQRINPLLPFTYAIRGMRETVGGIIWPIFIYNIVMLTVYIVISIALTLLLKKKLVNINEKLAEKFKDTGLVEE